ncbi:MAG: diacylglycerol kinase family lipid kinase [Brevinematales bacterium]|nr:diacylglycerol kinase family lipid kinase [Brevinematales bacterium]
MRKRKLTPHRYKKYLLIYNPRSGQGRYRQYIDETARYFRERGLELELRCTEEPGHATVIAREACASDTDVIIGAGGDGTINEVLNGMIGGDKTLAVLPWGTGNVFAAEMNIPAHPRQACKVITDGYSARLDAGRISVSSSPDNRHFLLMCGAGFDAYSIKKVEQLNIKRVIGKLAYAIGSIHAFSRYGFPEIEVELDNGRRDRGTFVLVSNTSRYGVYFTISPRAIPLDGLLDVYVFKEAGRWNFIKLVAQVLMTAFMPRTRRRKIFFKKQAFYRAKSVKLTSAHNVPTQIDGELFHPLPAVIEAAPSAINVILPKRVLMRMRKYI